MHRTHSQAEGAAMAVRCPPNPSSLCTRRALRATESLGVPVWWWDGCAGCALRVPAGQRCGGELVAAARMECAAAGTAVAARRCGDLGVGGAWVLPFIDSSGHLHCFGLGAHSRALGLNA